MWNACIKESVRHVFPPRSCVKLSALTTARAVGTMRRASTASAAEPRGEPVEPDTKVLETLVCPFSKSPLTYDRDARELVSPVGVAYPITASGIPNMMPACARIIPSNQEDGQEG